MFSRKTIWLTLGAMMIIAVALALILWSGKDDERLTVRFLDVGQGDAILLSQGSLQVLIDGGKDPKRLGELLGQYLPIWDGTVDAVVETHPDEDHIGGLLGIFGRYRVGSLLRSGEKSDSSVFSRLEEASKDAPNVDTFAPLALTFPNGAKLEALAPDDMLGDANQMKNTNDASVVLRLTYGKHSFLFTGDFPGTEEPDLLVGNTEVLKVGHHGSKSATTNAFLDELLPKYAIVSVGADNRYGHPAVETMDRLRAHNADILRTDERGTITFVCRKDQDSCDVTTEQ